MAGSVELVEHQTMDQAMAINAIIEQWEVQYARFLYYPPLSSLNSAAATHVTPHSALKRKRSRGGVWISTSSSSAASLKLIADRSTGSRDAILNLSLHSAVIEEHYISQLHVSWPQVSCVSGYPARGTRGVFLSYKDNVGQVQKFALRFLAVHETAKFIDVLKETLEDPEPIGLPSAEFNSEPSSEAEFVPSNGLPYRAEKEWGQTISADISTHELPPSLNSEVAQQSNSQEAMLDSAKEFLSDFPPSFTSFLMNCCPAADKAQPNGSDEVLKSQIVKYLEDSSFQDMLVKVEKVINELGDNNGIGIW